MVKSASLTTGKYYIPVIYTLIGITWILTSDAILNYLQHQGYLPISDMVDSAKGIAYVLITGFLLFILIRKSERDLLRSERQYKDIYLSNPYAIWFFDVNSYKFLSVNDAALLNYGFSRKEFLAMTVFDIHNPEDHEALMQYISTSNQDGYHIANWFQKKKNGDAIYVNSASLMSTFNNKPAIMMVVRDITEKIIYEKNLEQSNVYLEDTLKSISDSFFTLNRNWIITKANANFYERTGISEEVVGKSAKSLFPDMESTMIYQAGLRAMEERLPTKVDAYYDGLKKWLHVACYPTEEGIAVYFTDITDRKAREAEILKQNEQLRKVSWLNSHEIRKPVASLLSLVELFKAGPDQGEREQIIERIQKCTVELDKTIHQINQEASENFKSMF